MFFEFFIQGASADIQAGSSGGLVPAALVQHPGNGVFFTGLQCTDRGVRFGRLCIQQAGRWQPPGPSPW
jgi:hypothetical protein